MRSCLFMFINTSFLIRSTAVSVLWNQFPVGRLSFGVETVQSKVVVGLVEYSTSPKYASFHVNVLSLLGATTQV